MRARPTSCRVANNHCFFRIAMDMKITASSSDCVINFHPRLLTVVLTSISPFLLTFSSTIIVGQLSKNTSDGHQEVATDVLADPMVTRDALPGDENQNERTQRQIQNQCCHREEVVCDPTTFSAQHAATWARILPAFVCNTHTFPRKHRLWPMSCELLGWGQSSLYTTST